MTSPDHGALIRLHTAVIRLRRALDRERDRTLTPAQLTILTLLRDAPCGRFSDIIAAEGIAHSALNRLITPLIQIGHVQRGTTETDRRRVVLTLTDHGHALLDRVEEGIAERLEQRLARLPPAQRDAVLGALDGLEALTADAHAPDPPTSNVQ
ncbi:MarR family winged helix-turn-helix transcriptional regulator [Allonocardiopsis opalescens]|uniref:DNA-binding MarR family transcriptional regulator n=1 Tax=Allonocardiopsis opalescens TaxID=1144618 RepID=A0A2T0PTL8_9ACTN|nr:MarR family transcriptional regulator [Allonocardiopsis opalescens]PRX92242.1 DNA-binding MarR family transcriptional regulator [Allonocardiopsis opalescens]